MATADSMVSSGPESSALQLVRKYLTDKGMPVNAGNIRRAIEANAREPGSLESDPQTLGPVVLNLRNAGIEDASPMPQRGGGGGRTSAAPSASVSVGKPQIVGSDNTAAAPPGRTLISDATGNSSGPVTGSPEPPTPTTVPYIPGPPVQPSPMPASVANQVVSMPPQLATPVVTPEGMVAIDENNNSLGGTGTGAAVGTGAAAAGGLGALILRALLGGRSLPPTSAPLPPPVAGFTPEYAPAPSATRGAGFGPEFGQTLPTKPPVAGLPAGPQSTGPVGSVPENPAMQPPPQTPAGDAVTKAVGKDAPAPRAKAKPRAKARLRLP